MADSLGMQAGPIKGVPEAIKVLTDLPDALAIDLPKEAAGVAGSVASDVAAAFPGIIVFMHLPAGDFGSRRQPSIEKYDVAAEADVSNSADEVASVGGRDRQVPLFRVVVHGENAVFADMSTIPVNAAVSHRVSAIKSLNRTVGSPSRFAWPVAQRAQSRVTASMQRAAKGFEKDYTAALAEPSE